MTNKKCVIYTRVSKSDESQDPINQKEPLLHLAESLSFEVVKEYTDHASGGNSNRPQFQQMLEDATKRKFDMVLVWSLDRFSREGISNTLGYLERLDKNGVGLKSLQESWLDTTDNGVGKLLLAIMSWIASQERQRISERTKAGLKVALANGKKLGRPSGSKDKGRRRINGYLLRWQREMIQV
jgi:DNA invertase Pin-like site-specific DNA recombinase